MNRLNVRCAALLTALVLAIGIGSVGCDQVPDGVNAAAEGASQFDAKAIERSWPRIILPPWRR